MKNAVVDVLQFLEIKVNLGTQCGWCQRRKFRQNEKFYGVFLGESRLLTVCEICRDGYDIALRLGPERSYESHFAFFLKQKIYGVRDLLPDELKAELDHALENFLGGKYSESLRNIGFIAEWLTKKIFVMRFGESDISWDNMLGRLRSKAEKEEKTPEEVLTHQLFSLKWLRNKASHPSEYKIGVEDVMLGLVSTIYCLQYIKSYSPIVLLNE